MQDMKQERKVKLDATDVLWALVLVMQTGFLGACVYQEAWPEDLAWVGLILFLASAAVLCWTIRWAWRKKTQEEVAAQEAVAPEPVEEMIAWWRKVLFWSVSVATVGTAAEFGEEIHGNVLLNGTLLLVMYFALLWLIRSGRTDWILRKLR